MYTVHMKKRSMILRFRVLLILLAGLLLLGLVVAIPLTLFHSYLQGRARALIQVLEEQAAGIVARRAEQRR